MKRVVIRRAMFTEVVEIQWVRLDGSVYYERHTFPPKAVQDAREAERRASGRSSEVERQPEALRVGGSTPSVPTE